ncbi:nicotinamidase [Cerasicoccus frondis]|uniref:nicotinamidase n=1 Tax=Cerasicoccus frondis TaxID=490090 RepID=UPI002852564C|nr:nicotinamidase [Cerasicoccus frondis]
MKNTTALIIIDLNNDFMPGGVLGAAGADEVLPVINQLAASEEYALVVATQDWHPADHVSFAQWPPHCVAGTPGAELHPHLDDAHVDVVIRKGFDAHVDSYSGFYNEHGETNGLAELLRARRIEAVDIVGIATDYCVRATAIDAVTKAGFRTRVLLKGCRGVGLKPNDVPAALNAMREAGVVVID